MNTASLLTATPVAPVLSLSIPSPAPAHPPRPGLLPDPADRLAFRLGWNAYVHAHPTTAPTAQDIACRCLLLGHSLPRAFPPVTNATKLANGRRPYDTAGRTLRALDWTLSTRRADAPIAFGDFVLTADVRTALLAALKALPEQSLRDQAAAARAEG